MSNDGPLSTTHPIRFQRTVFKGTNARLWGYDGAVILLHLTQSFNTAAGDFPLPSRTDDSHDCNSTLAIIEDNS